MRGRGVREAVALTIATAGEAVLFSGLCVMIGFTSLLLINIPVTNSFALDGLAVACTAVAAALTLLPALLSVFGMRVNALRIPLYWLLGTSVQEIGLLCTVEHAFLPHYLR